MSDIRSNKGVRRRLKVLGGVAAVVVVSLVTACADASSSNIGSAGPGESRESSPSSREGKLIASGDGWDLRLKDYEVGGANWRVLCFTLGGPTLDNVSCSYVNPEYVGLAKVDTLESEWSLLYGTVSPPVSRLQVRFEDGSMTEADIFPAPGSIESEDNLFVLELHNPDGGTVATLLDKRGKRLATADFSLPPPKGEILFAFDRL